MLEIFFFLYLTDRMMGGGFCNNSLSRTHVNRALFGDLYFSVCVLYFN